MFKFLRNFQKILSFLKICKHFGKHFGKTWWNPENNLVNNFEKNLVKFWEYNGEILKKIQEKLKMWWSFEKILIKFWEKFGETLENNYWSFRENFVKNLRKIWWKIYTKIVFFLSISLWSLPINKKNIDCFDQDWPKKFYKNFDFQNNLQNFTIFSRTFFSNFSNIRITRIFKTISHNF